ncbi:MAG: septal ring lytic transglycosylase RlpA family protein [Methylococcales bacterium]
MRKILMVLIALFNSACTDNTIKDRGPTHVPMDVMAVADAIPKYEKRTRAGNPGVYEVLGKRYKILAQSSGYKKTGVASWYGEKFHGNKTANGERYNMYAMTAAHKTLPIPSYVRVTNLKNKRAVVVRVNDRGPFHDNRIIDLSYTAAVKLGFQKQGTALVEVEALGFDSAEVVEQTNNRFTEGALQTVFFLQVGAFNQVANATDLQEKLTVAKITSTRVQHVKNKQNDLYKVQVGPLHSEQQARQKSEELAKIGFTNAQLIVEKHLR